MLENVVKTYTSRGPVLLRSLWLLLLHSYRVRLVGGQSKTHARSRPRHVHFLWRQMEVFNNAEFSKSIKKIIVYLYFFKRTFIFKKVIHAAYYNLSIINALLVLIGLRKTHLGKFLNYSFVSAIFSIGSLVTIIFWGLFFINRELIWPKKLELLIPPWRNHVVHTMP